MSTSKRFVARFGVDNNSNTIQNVSDPVNAQDAATKAFSSNASNITSGTLSSSVLGGSTLYIGTTAVALNRASANQNLTGISSVTFPGSTSGTASLSAPAIAGSGAFVLPSTSGTLIGTGDTGTVTNTMLAGSIANAKLLNSSVTVNGSTVALGASTTITANTTNALTIGTGLSGTSFNGSSAVTIAIDSTVATLTGTQTLTNKTLTDSSTFFQDESDASKKLQFQLSGITTATTRTLTVPDASGTIALTSDIPTVNNGTLTMAVSGVGLSGSASFTANQSGSSTFTVTSNATSANTVSTIVARDASGNFTAGTITAALSGNASTATSLQTARTLWGQSFDGTANVTGSLTSVGDITGTGAVTLTATGGTLALTATSTNQITMNTNGTTRLSISSAGSVGIGVGAASTTTLRVGRNVTGGTAGFGITSLGTVQSDVTSSYDGIYSSVLTQATAFTLAAANAFTVPNVTIGSGSAITTFTGFNLNDITGPGTVYGFRGAVSSGTNKYNLYLDGTATSYIAGSLGIGTLSPSSKLQLGTAGSVGASAATNMIFGDYSTAAQLRYQFNNTGNYIGVGTDGGTNMIFGTSANNNGTSPTTLMTLTSGGLLGVGVSPSYMLDTRSALTGTTVASNAIVNVESAASGRDAHIRFGDTVNSAGRIGYLSGVLYFYTNGAERMRIDTSGRVGIGLTPTSYKLEVADDIRIAVAGGGGIRDTNGNAFLYTNLSTGQTKVAANHASGYVSLMVGATGGTEAVRVDVNSKVGIGTTTTSSPLNVVGAASIDTVGNTDKWVLRLRDSTSFAAGVGAGVLFQGVKSSGGAAGNFGGIAGIKENGTDGNEQGALVFYTTPVSGTMSERMRIDSTGMVCIGGTPQSGVPLTISTSNQTGIDIRSSNTSGAYISLVNTNTSATNLVGNYKATSGGGTFLNQDALLLRSANTIGFAPTSGTVTTFINASGNVLPGADATYDLGGTSLRFNNMYAGSYRFTSTTQFITNGVGTPEGAITASVGSVFLRVDGSTGTVLYVKESGTGNTGWTAMVSSGTISSITNGTSNVSVALNTQVTVTTAGSERVRVDSSGNVGIATNSPNEKLEVAGAGLFTGTAGSQNRNGLLLDRSGTVSRITSGNTSAAAATLEVYTTTSAGTETLAATFAANGDFTAVGNVTAYSDARLKTDLQIIPNALEKVLQLNGYTYTRIDSGERQTGLVAQEVMKVLPEVIAEMPSGHLSVAYGNLVGLLVEAIKELTAKVEDLEKRVK